MRALISFFLSFSIGNLSAHQDFTKEVQELQNVSLEKLDSLFKDDEFVGVVSQLEEKQKTACPVQTKKLTPQLLASNYKGQLYVFVSMSMGEKALLNLAHQAKQYGAQLVLRGFVDGSYRKTAQTLQPFIQKTGQGVIIDPGLFKSFNVQTVPTIVLTKQSQKNQETPLYDVLKGNVTLSYALEIFVKEGELKDLAIETFKRGKL